jgi:hypothetical protein
VCARCGFGGLRVLGRVNCFWCQWDFRGASPRLCPGTPLFFCQSISGRCGPVLSDHVVWRPAFWQLFGGSRPAFVRPLGSCLVVRGPLLSDLGGSRPAFVRPLGSCLVVRGPLLSDLGGSRPAFERPWWFAARFCATTWQLFGGSRPAFVRLLCGDYLGVVWRWFGGPLLCDHLVVVWRWWFFAGGGGSTRLRGGQSWINRSGAALFCQSISG